MTQIFIGTFIIFTLMHPIGDYIIRNFTWEKRYCDLLHYLICLNPLHALWDLTLGRIHAKHARHFNNVKEVHIYFTRKIRIVDFNFIKFGKRTEEIDILYSKYWLWLGIDQVAHVLLNLVFAFFLEVIF